MRTRSVLALLVLAAPLQAQLTIRVSVGPGGVEADGASQDSVLSADATIVAFSSLATNLVAGDTNAVRDVFVRDLAAGVTERISVSSGGGQANGDSFQSALSADGRIVAFTSTATNLVAFTTTSSRNVYLRDRAAGTTILVTTGIPGFGVNANCEQLSLSADGRFLAFLSLANNVVPGDTNSGRDVFLYDRTTASTSIVSLNSAGNHQDGLHSAPSLSADGRWIAFDSTAVLAPQGSSLGGVYLRDLVAGTTTCVSLTDGGATANGTSTTPSISADGRWVAFVSEATNLTSDVVTAQHNVYVRDLVAGRTQLVSRSLHATANGDCTAPSTGGDGRFVCFFSRATNLQSNDTTPDVDLILRDGWTGATWTLSSSASGQAVGGDLQFEVGPQLSIDGQTSVFVSPAPNLVPGDNNGVPDVFVHGRAAPPVVHLCAGDGSNGPCPCGNSGGFGRGCNNSNSTGGAILLPSGTARLSLDQLVLRVQGEPPDVFNLFLQGDAAIAPTSFGDGLSCVGGQVLRLYSGFAVNGSLAKPGPGELSVSTRPAALGFPIPPGATRVYQVLYRDPEDNFCPAPQGSNVNLSQAVALVWGP